MARDRQHNPDPNANAAQPRSRRRWYQFRLRTLVIGVTLAVVLSTLVWRIVVYVDASGHALAEGINRRIAESTTQPGGALGEGRSPAPQSGKTTDMKALIEQLSQLPLVGSSRGGPYVGISGNSVTESIVARGDAIVPLLAGRLENCDYDMAVYIVYCLRKIGACTARQPVEALKDQLDAGDRFGPHDLTLEREISHYLDVCK